MIDQYLTYWGLDKIPFSLTPDPEMLYLSSQHRECLLRLKYAIQSNKGGALLVSDHAGDGKTSVLSRLCQDMETEYGEKIKLVFIDHPTLTPTQLISELARQLGSLQKIRDKVDALNQLREQLQSYHDAGFKTVVIVDEGQMLSHRLDLLQELRILLNFCVAEAFLLTFIFSGQKPLEGIVRSMPEFWQRLPVRFFLKNLNLSETKDLIRFRLSKAGYTGTEIFTDFAYETIYKFSMGVPRVICSLADLCLVIGHSHGVKRIDFAQVSLACKDMDGGGEGFHYFHFLEKGKKEAQETKMPRESDYVPMVPCPHCQAAVAERRKVCPECNKSVVVKCPLCETPNRALVPSCKKCGCDMFKEETRLEQELSVKIRSFNDIRKNYAQNRTRAKTSYSLPPNNRILLAIPHGRFLKGSPHIEMAPSKGQQMSSRGTVVFTNEHIILDFKKQRIFLPYHEMKRSSSSNPTTKKSKALRTLSIDSADASYSITFPYSKSTAKKVIELLISYLKHKSFKYETD
ncbi:MAG: AAA family ATPase [Gemmatimonadota bacterium]|nr:MAG: AAA family ATPase [Gemmatimonadota bacterium]